MLKVRALIFFNTADLVVPSTEGRPVIFATQISAYNIAEDLDGCLVPDHLDVASHIVVICS
jgi:hypothetical protein